MKNKNLILSIYLIISFLIFSNSYSEEVFTFNVSEIEITENGNIYKGKNGGEVFSNDGTSITANSFEYNKSSNLKAIDNVKLKDAINQIIIEVDEITHFKDEEKILATGKVFVLDQNKKLEICR